VRASRKGKNIVYSYAEALKLNDFEVFISMLKFLVNLGLFQRPKLYQRFSPLFGFVCDVISVFIVVISNTNLVRCM